MESTAKPRLLLAILLLLVGASPARAADNLIANPSFNAVGEEAVPGWTVLRIAGKTTFRLERGVMVAERTAGPTTSADSLVQTILLPDDVRALRVAVRAAPARIGRAEVEFRFIRLDGRPGGRTTLFRLSGDHPLRDFEKDLLLPPDTKNVEIAFRICTPGKLLVDSASVSVIAPEEIRAEARFVRARGRSFVMPAGEEPFESTRLSVPIPPPTQTQCPVSLAVRSEPSGRVKSARIVNDDDGCRLELVVGPLEPACRVRIEWTARLFLTDRAGESAVPMESAVAAPGAPEADERVTAGLEDLDGPDGGRPFCVVAIGNLTLPKGAAADFIAGLVTAWTKAARKFSEDRGATIDLRRLSLPGSAKKVTAGVKELIGE